MHLYCFHKPNTSGAKSYIDSFLNQIFLGSSWPLANCSNYHTRSFFPSQFSRCQLIRPAHHGDLGICHLHEECLPSSQVSLGNVGQESQGKDLLLIRSKQTLEWSWKNFSVLLVILNFGSAIDNIMTRLILSHTWTSFSDFELPWTSLLGLAGDLAKQQSTY